MKGVCKAIAYFVLYYVITMISQSILLIGFILLNAKKNGLNKENLSIELIINNSFGIAIISGILSVLILYLIFKLRKKQVKKEWKLNKFKFKNLILVLITVFSFSIILNLCTYNISMENPNLKSVEFYNRKIPLLGTIMLITNLLIIAPITEEIVFRGIVYTRVEKTTNNVIAIIVSSILFGLIHFEAGGVILIIGAILMALVFGYIFYKFKSLWICIIAHGVANLPDLIFYNKPEIPNGIFVTLLIIFIGIFIAGMCAIQKTVKNDYE